ncbi:CATRA conflict system CASPASE/TPR repeat-associated protein [Kitasatospora sp. NPDC051853]|uniref:CATRA conflict system CASPASE/TPR repeat-associated protein n=1 Tax=Kitasatospora sp. NPDC051853 TaxID=3364058 RepID=UPI0037B6FC14
MTPADHDLILHLFVGRDALDGAAGELLRAWWRACREHGMTQPLLGLPLEVPEQLPGEGERPGSFRALAGRKRPGTAGPAQQALCYVQHDVVGVVVLLATAPGEPWTRAERDWQAAVARHGGGAAGDPAPDGVLGTAVVHRVVTDAAAPATLLREAGMRVGFTTAVGVAVPTARALQLPDAQGEFLVFSPPAESTGGRSRRLAVLAARADEGLLDSWIWSHGATEATALRPTGLHRYLLQSAKLHDQYLAFADRQAGFRAHRDLVDRLTDRMVGLCAEPTRDGTSHRAAQFLALENALAELQQAADTLLTYRTRLERFRRQAELAAANADLAVPPVAGAPLGGLFAEDTALRGWLLRQTEHDAEDFRLVGDRADTVVRNATALVQQRLHQRQQQLTLLQTSVLGGVLMVLAAVQALDYRPPLPGPFHGPVIALLGALATVLPGSVLRWARETGRRARPSLTDRLAMTALGACTGWLAATAVSSWHTAAPAPPAWSLPAAALGALTAALLERRR